MSPSVAFKRDRDVSRGLHLLSCWLGLNPKPIPKVFTLTEGRMTTIVSGGSKLSPGVDTNTASLKHRPSPSVLENKSRFTESRLQSQESLPLGTPVSSGILHRSGKCPTFHIDPISPLLLRSLWIVGWLIINMECLTLGLLRRLF